LAPRPELHKALGHPKPKPAVAAGDEHRLAAGGPLANPAHHLPRICCSCKVGMDKGWRISGSRDRGALARALHSVVFVPLQLRAHEVRFHKTTYLPVQHSHRITGMILLGPLPSPMGLLDDCQ
jgi:hypothetical protein